MSLRLRDETTGVKEARLQFVSFLNFIAERKERVSRAQQLDTVGEGNEQGVRSEAPGSYSGKGPVRNDTVSATGRTPPHSRNDIHTTDMRTELMGQNHHLDPMPNDRNDTDSSFLPPRNDQDSLMEQWWFRGDGEGVKRGHYVMPRHGSLP